MEPRDRLIAALDVSSLDQALRLADTLAAEVGRFKVGLELFTRAGPQGVHAVAERAPVMLDLKLHDIPATVARTAAALADLDVDLVTLHAAGGAEMMARAVDTAPSLRLLAVTVLTSLDSKTLAQVGVQEDIKDVVARRASLALASGCAGVVASPKEAAMLRRLLGPRALIVTPGVRPAGSMNRDQRRTATAQAAVAAGADFIVVGRPIRDASEPVEAARRIVDEIAAGLGS